MPSCKSIQRLGFDYRCVSGQMSRGRGVTRSQPTRNPLPQPSAPSSQVVAGASGSIVLATHKRATEPTLTMMASSPTIVLLSRVCQSRCWAHEPGRQRNSEAADPEPTATAVHWVAGASRGIILKTHIRATEPTFSTMASSSTIRLLSRVRQSRCCSRFVKWTVARVRTSKILV